MMNRRRMTKTGLAAYIFNRSHSILAVGQRRACSAALVALLSAAVWAGGSPPAFTEDLILWYEQPAADWEREALPVGNGRLGAMVFGGVGNERIQLNDDTLWAGFKRDCHNPKALEALPEVQRLMFAGKNREAARLASQTMMGRPRTIKSYQTLGDLGIEFVGIGAASDYRRELNLETAIARTSFMSDGALHEREVFVSAPDDVIVVRLSSSKKGGLSFALDLTRPLDTRHPERYPFTSVAEADDYLVMAGVNDDGDGMSWQAHLRILPQGGSLSRDGNRLVVSKADAATLLLASGTDFKFEDPADECRRRIAAAAAKGYANLRRDHINDHQALFGRVELHIDHEDKSAIPTDRRLEEYKRHKSDIGLELLYFQYGRYLLIGSSRPGTLPATLQGIWNNKLRAPWNSDFHANINLQMNYWPAQVANLAECKLPLIDLMESLVEPGSETARRHYGADGWVLHHLTDIWGFTVPADGVHGIWPMGAAWLCRSAWEHYLFGLDRGFLSERAYPLMKGASEFMLDFLVLAPAGVPGAGYLVTNPSHSPENSFILPNGERALFTYGATMDIMIIRNLFKNTIAAIDTLGGDSEKDFRRRLEAALDKLPPLQISQRTGGIQEWIADYKEAQPGHRHISHLYALHPAADITPRETPMLAEAMRNTLAQRGDGGSGWAMAVRQNGWARLLDGDRAHDMLKKLLSKRTMHNLLDTHPPFQIDGNFGGCAGVAEMLLQSHAGYIEFIPALPQAWSSGSFRGLRARGGFEIDLDWDGHSMTRARIRSANGGQCRIYSPEPIKIRRQGEVVTLDRPEKNIFVFATDVAEVYEVRLVR
jgi:alpha-L-fucosidase 2